MSNRYFYYLLVAATTLLVLGCATHPPAHIIDDRYINFEYGYSIEIPEGWAVHERAPAKILKNFGWKRREVSLLFFNESYPGGLDNDFKFAIIPLPNGNPGAGTAIDAKPL